MNLNLTVTADRIPSYSIILKKTDPLIKMELSYVAFYEERQGFSRDRLYISYGNKLPEHPVLEPSVSIISIGDCPEAYYREPCELLVIDQQTDIFSLFNRIQDIFSFFNNWELKLQKALITDSPLSLIGDLAYEVFENPLACFNRLNRAEFLKYNKNDPETLRYYETEPSEGSFMSEDEENLILSAPDLSETFSSHTPALYPRGVFRYDHIYCNIFEDNYFLGRIIIDNAYRDFIDSDYPLLKWLCEFMQPLMMQSSNISLGSTKRLEEAMRHLLIRHSPYQKRFDITLAECGWSRYDTYRCIYLQSLNLLPSENRTAEFALYLDNHFSQKYILVEKDCISMVINITKNTLSDLSIHERLDFFINNNPFRVGISSSFNDMADVWNYRLQAQTALLAGEQNEPQSHIHRFEKLALTVMLENFRKQYNKEFFYTDAVKRLIAYDQENNIDFCETIRVYLNNNNNVAASMKELHFCRSTFLYRLKRIQELSGFDLDDPETRLYLMLLFRI